MLLWDFPICLDGNGTKWHYSQSCVSTGTAPSDPLLWFLPWPCRSLSAKYMRGAPADLQMPPSLQCSLVPLLWLLALKTCTPWTLNAISSPQGRCWAPLGLPFPAHDLETFSRQQAGAITGLTAFVSHLTGIAGFHCLMSIVLFTHFVWYFSSFRWETKSNFCFSISAESRSWSWCILMGCYSGKCVCPGEKWKAEFALWNEWESHQAHTVPLNIPKQFPSPGSGHKWHSDLVSFLVFSSKRHTSVIP